jgi:hypothetical protein
MPGVNLEVNSQGFDSLERRDRVMSIEQLLGYGHLIGFEGSGVFRDDGRPNQGENEKEVEDGECFDVGARLFCESLTRNAT